MNVTSSFAHIKYHGLDMPRAIVQQRHLRHPLAATLARAGARALALAEPSRLGGKRLFWAERCAKEWSLAATMVME